MANITALKKCNANFGWQVGPKKRLAKISRFLLGNILRFCDLRCNLSQKMPTYDELYLSIIF